MCTVGRPETDDKESRMNAHLIVGSVGCSLAKECKRLCDDEVRFNGVQGHREHKKREDTHKFKKRVYYLQNKGNVGMVGKKKESSGFRKGVRNEISSMYNIRYDPEFRVGKAVVRTISCAWSFCIKQLDLPWDKNKKTQVKRSIERTR